MAHKYRSLPLAVSEIVGNWKGGSEQTFDKYQIGGIFGMIFFGCVWMTKFQLINPAKWVSLDILFVCLSQHDIWNVKVSSKQGSLSKMIYQMQLAGSRSKAVQ